MNAQTGKPIFKKILMPVIFLIVLEFLMLLASVFGGGLTTHLNQNARDILNEKVVNRRNYLESEMVNNWSQLKIAVDTVNVKTQNLIDLGAVSLKELENGSESCASLLTDISGDLIALMRSNKVTGAYVVFNNQDLSDLERTVQKKSGIYLRDMDPVTNASYQNNDILIERAPSAVAQSLPIPLDNNWQPQFEFGMDGAHYYDFLRVPYQAAFENHNQSLSWSDFGHWSGPYALYGDDQDAIYYSVPLILKDGTVYGVLGIEVSLDYLKKVVPYEETGEDKKGSYVIARTEGDQTVFQSVLINGPMFRQAVGKNKVIELDGSANDYSVTADDKTFYCSVENLKLYNSNAPFSDQQWALIGMVQEDDLYAFSYKITRNLMAAIFFTLAASVVGSFLVSRMISSPVSELLTDIAAMNTSKAIDLKRTGILEIDRLEESIEVLSRDVIDSATKFTQIIELASVKIAGFELRKDSGQLFITDGFFEIFHRKGINTHEITLQEFERTMEEVNEHAEVVEHDGESTIFRIVDESGLISFIKLKSVDDEVRRIGLAEDVTQTVLEKDRIEHERDHDLLTGLMNRRAFNRTLRDLFAEGDSMLKIAALVMLDLDNLKKVNDTYGHDYGDKYICKAAECFAQAAPPGAIVSRISGDEFYLLYYGYETKEEIRDCLLQLSEAIGRAKLSLPNHEALYLHASGGIAWYPDDSTSYEELLKYSDFAMYRVKQSEKGALREFDMGVFKREAYLLQNKAELSELIEQSKVIYFLQPIVDARTAEIFGYEALMRANMPTLHSAVEIIELARLESKLYEIERLTWMKSMSTYKALVDSGQIPQGCRFFINSIASMRMTDEEIVEFQDQYKEYLSAIVLELTEEEQVNEESMNCKKRKIAEWGATLALDDYGSGYNSELMLLEISPQFVKIDLSIIRNIDRDVNKQKIVENVVSYAHERGIKIIAEGVETDAEIRTVMGMNVDYLQGFWIARPAAEPPVLSEECRSFLLNLVQNKR